MSNYEIFLKNHKVKFYSRFGWLIIIINFFVIAYLTYVLDKLSMNKLPLMVLAVVILISLYFTIVKKNDLADLKHLVPFCIILPAWINLDFPWIAGLNAVLFLMSLIAGKTPVIYIDDREIFYPSFPKKKIKWNELTNMILKDGYLTIDFKNNKLIQQLVDETQTRIDEKEFNEFCQQQLNK